MHKWNKIFRINKTLPQKFVSWYIFSPTVLLLILSSMRKNRKRLLHIFIKCHKKPYFGNCFSFLWAKTQCVSFFFKHFFLYVEKKFELYGNGTGEIVVYLKNRFHNFWQKNTTSWVLLTVGIIIDTMQHSVIHQSDTHVYTAIKTGILLLKQLKKTCNFVLWKIKGKNPTSTQTSLCVSGSEQMLKITIHYTQ